MTDKLFRVIGFCSHDPKKHSHIPEELVAALRGAMMDLRGRDISVRVLWDLERDIKKAIVDHLALSEKEGTLGSIRAEVVSGGILSLTCEGESLFDVIEDLYV